MEILRNFAITAVAAGSVLLSGASGVQAATACQDAALSDFSTQADLDAWLAGTDGTGTEFVTATNGALMCEFSDLGKTNSSSETETEVNAHFFTSSVSSWSFIDKENGSYTTSGMLQSSAISGSSFDEEGNWKILDSFFDTYDVGFLVFKDGEANPETFVGYKVTQTADGDVTGTYSSMFFKSNTTGGLKGDAVSHISLYGGDVFDPPGGVVPLPAGLPLLLSALGLGGLLRLRQRKAA